MLAACALEAAWITLVYILVASLAAAGPAPLSLLAFSGATLVGLGFARWSARHPGHPYATPLAGIAIAAAIIGWLLPLGPAAARVIEDPTVVAAMHPGGLLLGLAVLRGSAHVTPEDDERIAETGLGPGLVFLAVFWVLLTATGGTYDASNVGAAYTATVAFVTAGLLSSGLARLADLRSTGVRGADRRIWVGVLIGVVTGLFAVAIPLALLLGVPVDGAIRGALGLVGGVLVVVATWLVLPAALLGMALFLLIQFLRTGAGTVTTDPGLILGGGVDWRGLIGSATNNGLVLGVVPLIVATVVAFLLVRSLLRRPRRSSVDGDVIEIREADGTIRGVRLRRPHLTMPRRQVVPRTASEAYVASVEVLADRPETARLPFETPSEHARRVRADPIGGPLRRLAADYALEEFGRRTLSPAEHRRAVERWRRLRAMRER